MLMLFLKFVEGSLIQYYFCTILGGGGGINTKLLLVIFPKPEGCKINMYSTNTKSGHANRGTQYLASCVKFLGIWLLNMLSDFLY